MFASPGFSQELTQRQLSQPYDAVFVFCSSMFPYIEKSEFKNTRVVVDLVDVDSQKWEQLGRVAIFPKRSVFLREAKRLRVVEQRIADRANAVTLVSNEEASLYRSVVRVPGQTKIAGISNGVNTDYFQPSVSNCEHDGRAVRLVFTGVMNYTPNVKGMEWFCRKVLPRLQGKIDVQTTIVGRSPNARVRSLGFLDGVEVTGEVEDVRPYLNSADIVISPLSLARGIQNKVLEAMAMQRAVVCTSQSAEGISGRNQVHFVIADTVDQWCDALVDLSKNRPKRERLASAARQLVVQSYSWSAQTKPMLDLLTPKLAMSRATLTNQLASISFTKNFYPQSSQCLIQT